MPTSESNLVILNGVLNSWGGNGVDANNAGNSQLDRLSASGCASAVNQINSGGLCAGSNCFVSICTASGNGGSGIFTGGNCTIKDCHAINNTEGDGGIVTGESCIVKDCTASGNWIGFSVAGGCAVISCNGSDNVVAGVIVDGSSTVKDCNASGNGIGIEIYGSSTVIACTASFNEEFGVIFGNGDYVDGGIVKDCTACANGVAGIAVGGKGIPGDIGGGANWCLVAGNSCADNGSFGIYVEGIGNCIEGNMCGNNGENGIQVLATQTRIDGNHVSFNGSYGIYPAYANVTNSITRNSAPVNAVSGYGNYSGNNDYAPIGTPNSSTNPWANF